MSDCQTTSCPFAFTDESETVQNYGCLPSPFEIISMRQDHGKTWACHSDTTKPCAGAIRYQNSKDLNCSVIDINLVDESNWAEYRQQFTKEST
ncbi:hypothetical protein [uncultured Paraglaciecola sp.]|uniref:hypothetical protein n=1 Tax=uncultured Paraglaciecola sp. TaxID=1765024 RepID=UPI002605FBCA|nr:hypothetical protein [uncultured Paraglaciecola sp.]